MDKIHVTLENESQKQNFIQEKSLRMSLVQIDRLNADQKKKKFYYYLDIFKFLPVPKTDSISTKYSLVGSFIMLGIFFAYVISSLIMFCTNNPPRLNQYLNPLPNKVYNMPRVAISFLNGTNLDQPWNNYTSYFELKLDLVTKTPDLNKTYNQQILQPCNEDPSNQQWMTGLNLSKFLCPQNQSNLILLGLINTSPTYSYVRFVVSLCNRKNQSCVDYDELQNVLSGGRLFLYVENRGSINLANFEINKEYNYFAYQFFLVQGLYNRAEIILQNQNLIIWPDYLTSFQTREFEYLTVNGNFFYVSNVTVYDNSSCFTVWFSLDAQNNFKEAVYITFIDKIASWGALWGVLFAIFAFGFLQFNQKQFYKRNPKWDKFDQTLDDLGQDNLDKINREQENTVQVTSLQSSQQK